MKLVASLCPYAQVRRTKVYIVDIKLSAIFVAESFSRFLGQETASAGVSRIFDMFQHSTLNRHLIFTLADAILQLILQEMTSPS